jgi:predicted Zn-dependent protease
MYRFYKPDCFFATVCFCAASILGEGALRAQQECSVTAEIKMAEAPANIFSVQQEQLLGEIEAEEVEKAYAAVHDEHLEAHLNVVADRLMSAARSDQRRVYVTLLDAPEANAFSVGSDRIYITRQLVALLRNDDELAGVLGHELGHIELHQNAITMSCLFRQILGTDSVGDRKDIAEKLRQTMTSINRDPKMLRRAARVVEAQEGINEFAADRFALYASARAGFSPQAVVSLLDRTGGTKGKVGNFLSDFAGTTNANQLRLREASKALRALPPACREIVPAEVGEFRAWQAAVDSYADLTTR